MPSPDLESWAVRFPLPTAFSSLVERGLQWSKKQAGSRYGWADIRDQALRLLGLPSFVGRLYSLDCSHLAAWYCLISTWHTRLQDAVLECPQENSPNDLARIVGLLK